jgi:NitT/TauT family transport system substrate-binding protein
MKMHRDKFAGRPAGKTSLIVLAICLLAIIIRPASSDTLGPTVRVGALKFGTVNWELSIIKSHKLDKREGITLEVVPLASKNASNVALLGGAADIIVSDWIWVSRLRAEGRPYVFVPYSLLAGKLIVPEDSKLNSIAGLKGESLGIAGGPLDKNWLLLRAYTKKTIGIDLAELVEAKFVAPPLLNELFLRGELSAGLTFWHYAAILEASGMKAFVSIPDILPELGVSHAVPLLGWVFSEETVKYKRQEILAFLRASYAAKQILAESDAAWESLRTIMKVNSEEEFVALRQEYRNGIPTRFGVDEIRAAEQVFSILADIGGEDLTGSTNHLSAGTFWPDYKIK